MTKYFIDISDIFGYMSKNDTITGIQRVVFSVARRLAELHGTEAVKLSFWEKKSKIYYAIDARFLLESGGVDMGYIRSALGHGAPMSDRKAPTLEEYKSDRPKYMMNFLLREWNSRIGNKKHFVKRGSSLEEWRDYKKKSASAPSTLKNSLEKVPVESIASAGDKICFLGGIWNVIELEGVGRHFRSKGLQITAMVYDMIPILFPEHVGPRLSVNFLRWLRTTPDYCDGYFAISKSSAEDLKRFLREIGKERPVSVISLVQEFQISSDSRKKTDTMVGNLENATKIRPDVWEVKKYPFVLAVGTMESRKNNWGLAQAWQQLAQDPTIDLPKLAFAGKKGWANAEFFEWMKASGNLDGWVSIVEKPSDEELAFLYENCEFTAMVSFYEGWGLPIGESLSHGKTAVVADNSSLPEVGMDMVEYCDAKSVSSIAAACRKLIVDKDHRARLEERIRQTKLRTWDDVADDFLAALE